MNPGFDWYFTHRVNLLHWKLLFCQLQLTLMKEWIQSKATRRCLWIVSWVSSTFQKFSRIPSQYSFCQELEQMSPLWCNHPCSCPSLGSKTHCNLKSSFIIQNLAIIIVKKIVFFLEMLKKTVACECRGRGNLWSWSPLSCYKARGRILSAPQLRNFHF